MKHKLGQSTCKNWQARFDWRHAETRRRELITVCTVCRAASWTDDLWRVVSIEEGNGLFGWRESELSQRLLVCDERCALLLVSLQRSREILRYLG